jgi:Tfp pilus assembly PilM family ATPase
MGCINEYSGELQDISRVRGLLEVALGCDLRDFGPKEIFFAVPQSLAYRTAFEVPADLQRASIDELLATYAAKLPGDLDSLVVDAYAHEPDFVNRRSVMILAARRNAIETYARLLEGREWLIGGITTAEIARFNLWNTFQPEVATQVVFVCSADNHSRELSLWDRGVLVASDTRCWLQGDKVSEDLAKDIKQLSAQHSRTGSPPESVLLGGALCELIELQDRIRSDCGINCWVSQPLLRAIQTTRGQNYDHNNIRLMEDAVGVIAPKLRTPGAAYRKRRHGVY